METGTTTQGVIGEVEYMIRFMVRHVNDEQMESAIDGVDEADASSEKVEGADAAVADAMNAVGDFVVDVGSGEDRSSAAVTCGFVEPTLHPALASAELMSYFELHSKSLSAGVEVVWTLH